MIIQNINPEIIDLGIISLRYYGILFGMGIFLGYFISKNLSIMKGFDIKILDKALLFIVVGIVIGAHLVHLLFYEPKSFINNPIRIIEIGSGLASHGGILGAFIGFYVYYKINKKIIFWEYVDLIVVSGSIAAPFIRLGNFFNSEIYGIKTDLPIGIIFKQAGETIPRHPTQLYEMIIGLFIFIFLYYFYKKNHNRIKNGTIFLIFMILYFTLRFLIEFLKEYQGIDNNLFFTMGQYLSLPFIIMGLFIFIYKKFYLINLQKK